MPRTSLRRLSTLAAVRAAAAARRVGPVHGNLLSVMGLLMEKSLQKREREESTPRRTPVRKRKRPAPQEPSTSYTPGGFWTLLHHPQAHLEQSALLLLLGVIGALWAPPINQKINCSISVVCCLTLFIPPEHSYFFNFKSLHCIHFWSYRDDTHMVGLVKDRRIKLQIFFLNANFSIEIKTIMKIIIYNHKKTSLVFFFFFFLFKLFEIFNL